MRAEVVSAARAMVRLMLSIFWLSKGIFGCMANPQTTPTTSGIWNYLSEINIGIIGVRG
jgi:hypothetical protein